MADTNINTTKEGGGNATTVLVTIIIILIIAAAAYFGFMRGHKPASPTQTIDINATLPVGTEGGGPAE